MCVHPSTHFSSFDIVVQLKGNLAQQCQAEDKTEASCTMHDLEAGGELSASAVEA